ncbi:MAG: hypothetical protein VR71_10600 [Roseovarius sp. BRH_c41]|uniref:hypothetical protein n=1 Tax=Roseovarius sp. BRH_c41 TaxID=1629709 RepID=UPI0005F1AC6B|nr:hypothetical protein [Roseovarius sp. BRH_c41]KJS43358.1 MAG: hypothetical protein VR71_10600 [Roseovarius sp. BRH_c41]
MSYRIKRTVIAAKRLEIGDQVNAKDIGTEAQVARLLALGAIEKAGDEAGTVTPLEMDDALRAALTNAINDLPGDAFDKSGKPKVKALQDAAPSIADRITAAARDTVWAEMQAAANAAT